MKRDLLDFCKKRVRERAQLNRIDPCVVYKITGTAEDRKRQTLRRRRLLYTVTIILCPTVFGLVAELHQKCILSAEFYKCRNADVNSHTYTSIPQLSSPFSLMLTVFLPLPRAFLSLSLSPSFTHYGFLILLISLLLLQQVRLNTVIPIRRKKGNNTSVGLIQYQSK